MKQIDARVVATETVGRGLHLLVLDVPEVASVVQPGQFVMVRCAELTLRRPLSVHAASDRLLALLFRLVGQGTQALSALSEGDAVSITGPLGTGFTVPSGSEKALLMAGGIGIAPLWFLASRLPDSVGAVLVYGTKTAAERYIMPQSLPELIPSAGGVDAIRRVDVTDDGSYGERSDACGATLPYLHRAHRVYVCGPLPMCIAADKAVCGNATVAGSERLLDAEVSLETRMACGVGACYSCSIETKVGRRKVCVDGPVFRWGDVLWSELIT
ncbi:MAG: dihydroorotate dehydrogenase electron transfer subunit [Chloroflexota bacterium]